MFSRHVLPQLAAHVDGELPSRKAQRFELHVSQCERCRVELEQVRFGMSLLDHLPTVQAPDAIWTSIETAFQQHRLHRPRSLHRWRLALAALAVVAVAGGTYWSVAHRSETRWEVVQIHATPAVDAKPVRSVARIGAGNWIETDSSSNATVKVGRIGSLDVAPNTRLLVVTARSGEHRVELVRGKIHAKISAPPRLFFVDTASGTAVDLGCEYSLHTDEEGSGLLQVTGGWVSFQWKGVESLVPAGASCRTRPHAGPGLPCFDDAPEKLKNAIDSFDTEKPGGTSLKIILSEARVRDTLTLWHLLSRVELPDRERIYDRIAALTPVPPGVSRQKVLELDPGTLTRWKDELAWTW